MERWKRKVASLLLVFTLVYGAYLLWLYSGSGGTMVVGYELPGSWFPLLVVVLTFGMAFLGGFLITALTREDLIAKRAFLFQLLALSILFGFLAGIMVTAMEWGEYRPFLLAVFLIGLGLWVAFARWHSREIQADAPITDEREEIIDLRSKAIVSDAIITLLAAMLIGDTFGLWKLDETPTYLLLAVWGFSYIASQLYYRRVM